MKNIDIVYCCPQTSLPGFVDFPDREGYCISVYFTGCTHNCPDCQNKSLQGMGRIETSYYVGEFISVLKEQASKIKTKKICFLGGDPCVEQNRYVLKHILSALHDYETCVYTGYSYEDIKDFVVGAKYVVTEKFDKTQFVTPEKTDDYFQLASKNQKIYNKKQELISKDGRLLYDRIY